MHFVSFVKEAGPERERSKLNLKYERSGAGARDLKSNSLPIPEMNSANWQTIEVSRIGLDN